MFLQLADKPKKLQHVAGYNRSPKVRAYTRAVAMNDGVTYLPHMAEPGVLVREDFYDNLNDFDFVQTLADAGMSEDEINFLAGKRRKRKQEEKQGKSEAKVAKKKAKADKKQAKADKKRSSGKAKETRAQAKQDKANNPREKKSFEEIVGGVTAVVDSAGQVVQAWKGNDPYNPDAQIDPASVPGAKKDTISIMGMEVAPMTLVIGGLVIGGGLYFLSKRK